MLIWKQKGFKSVLTHLSFVLLFFFFRPAGGSEVTSFPALPSSNKPAQRRGSGNSSETGPRLRQLESRLNINEQSNRALLEELVRLQGELKSCVRRNEDSLRGEREERLILSEKIRAASNLYTQMTMRLARTEERLESERDAVGSLVNHTKQVEQAILGSQQQLMSRREQAHVQMERIKDDIDELRGTFEQAQKNMRAMAADLRTFKSKQEINSEHLGTTIQEIRQRIKKVEGETQLAVSINLCNKTIAQRPLIQVFHYTAAGYKSFLVLKY